MSENVNNTKISQDGVSIVHRDLAKSERILQVCDLVSGPGRGKKPLCLGCLSIGSSSELTGCKTCSWPLCEDCQNAASHLAECRLFSKAGFRYSQTKDVTDALDFITPLRLLLKLEENKEAKDRIFKLNFNVEKIKKRNAKVYGEDKDAKIVEIIKNKLKYDTEIADIENAIAVVEKFSMVLDSINGSIGVYDDLGQLTHSCSPNSYISCTTNRQMVVRASMPLEKGTKVTYSKVDNMKCNTFRKRLMETSLVDCSCTRCQDGTEFGTGFGSIICRDCGGLLSSTDPGKDDIDWKCSGCNIKLKGRDCINILDALQKKLEEAHEEENPKTYEKILLREEDWSQLPENSCLFQEVRHSLINLYQYHKDYYFAEEGYLQAKINHADTWINLQQQLCPGLSYAWARVMLEKVQASVSLLVAKKMAGAPAEETNGFISEINKMTNAPIDMMNEEEDQSYITNIRASKQIAVEAREEQKKRVIINLWANDEDDDWTGYT